MERRRGNPLRGRVVRNSGEAAERRPGNSPRTGARRRPPQPAFEVISLSRHRELVAARFQRAEGDQ